MQMEAGLDTGPVLLEQAIELSTNAQAGQLHVRLSELTAEMMIEAVNALASGQAILTPQKEEGVTYAHKITNAETCLSFDMPAEILARKISAFSPFPAASVETISGRLKLLAAIHLEGEKHQSLPGHFLGGGTNEGIKIACANQSIWKSPPEAGRQTGHERLCLFKWTRLGNRQLYRKGRQMSQPDTEPETRLDTAADTHRMLITVEYDGTGLVGWQRQNNGPSVQACLEAAAEKLTSRKPLFRARGALMQAFMQAHRPPIWMYRQA